MEEHMFVRAGVTLPYSIIPRAWDKNYAADYDADL